MKMLRIVGIAMFGTLVLAGAYWWMQPTHVFCGGIAGLPCPSFGYTCISEGTYPDAGTNCTKMFTR
jgi:hypothetical protein